jgi:Leu/Phe-tRNA-protein transferase
VNYYWSDEWDEWLYIKLAQLGFISTSYDTLEGLVLLPELQFEYGLLDFDNLYIDPKVQKLIREDRYTLTFDTHFDEVMQNIAAHHQRYNWLKGQYLTLIQKIYKNHTAYDNFRLHSVELLSKETKELIAGEIGYTIGNTYTSLSGYSSREKRYNNCGKLQLVLLGEHLHRRGFSFWNLGHPHMEYKKRLGVTVLPREAFLKRWNIAANQRLKDLYE